MDWVWNPWALPSMVVVLGAWLMATIVFVTRPERPQNRLLAAYLVLESFTFLWLSVLPRMTSTHSTAYAVFGTGYFVWPWIIVLYLLFLSTLDTPLVALLRRRSVRTTILLLGTTVSLAALLWPSLWFDGLVTPWYGGLAGGGGTVLNRSMFTSSLIVSLFALVAAISSLRRAPPYGPSRSKARAFVNAFAFRDAGMVLFAASQLTMWSVFAESRFIAGDYVLLLLWPLSVTVMHGFLALGILRAQLFDIDLKVKWTINKSTLVGIFVGVFFITAQIAQAFVTTEYGWAIGGLIAGLLLLGLNPLQRFAERVADSAMPDVHDTPEYLDERKADVYLATLEEMIADGTVNVKERRALMRLQQQLGLDDRVTNRLEKDLLNKTEGF